MTLQNLITLFTLGIEVDAILLAAHNLPKPASTYRYTIPANRVIVSVHLVLPWQPHRGLRLTIKPP